MEFDYPEIYAPIDLGIGQCRLAVAEPAEMAGSDDPRRWSHVRIATKYPEVTRRHFAARGVQAECVKLSGAMELAPSLGLSHRIVDLVDSGRTLKENGLVEIEHIADITSRFIVNRAALKTQPERIGHWVDRFREMRPVPPRGSTPRRRASTRTFRAFLGAQSRHRRECRSRRGRHHRRRARARRRGGGRLHAASSTGSTPTPRACASPTPSGAPRRPRCRRRSARRWRFAARRIEAFHRALLPQGRRLHRRHRHAARRALSAARVGRRLRAGRHGGLSVLGADEHRAGQGGGRAAHRHGRADAGRRAQSAGHAGGRDRRRRRDLAHRRRPGGGGARLRHRNRSRRSTRSPAPATPMSPPPSAACSARSAST